MTHFSILAQQDNDSAIPVKVILVLIFGAIWVLAQVFSAIGKKKDKVRPPEVTLPPEAPLPQRQRPMPRQDRPIKQRRETKQRQRVEPPPRREVQVRREAPPLPQQRRPPVVVAPARVEATLVEPPPSSPIVTGALGAKRAAANAPERGPNAQERLRAILRPKNLRKEFILTEILQPPLATRPDRDLR